MLSILIIGTTVPSAGTIFTYFVPVVLVLLASLSISWALSRLHLWLM